ncbi:MAG: carbohydrate ABC transporter permease, partial [Actinomycetota bacterium]
ATTTVERTVPPAAAPQRRRGGRSRWRYRGTVAMFMSPWIIGFLIFTLYPMVASLYFSFTHYDLLGTPIWIGFKNYQFMFTKDPFFWPAVWNTVYIIAIGLPLRVFFGILTAMLLTRPRRGVKVYRTVFFLPTMAPAVAASLAFVYLLNPQWGPVNNILRGVGVANPPLWFFDPTWSKPALILLGLWGVGDAMIIFLAGLLDVPRQLYEAADIEGASPLQKFRYVTLPMISPVIFFIVVTGIIWGFQYFTEAYVASWNTTSQVIGAPQNSLLFYSVYLYQQGFTLFKMGYASSMAWVLLVITMICTLAVLRGSRRWIHYQGGGMFR